MSIKGKSRTIISPLNSLKELRGMMEDGQSMLTKLRTAQNITEQTEYITVIKREIDQRVNEGYREEDTGLTFSMRDKPQVN